MEIKNFMEGAVDLILKEVIDDLNICKCKMCLLDIKAMTLNDLPPRYFVTENGELYSKINALVSQFEVDIIAAVTKSAVLVKRNPRNHN